MSINDILKEANKLLAQIDEERRQDVYLGYNIETNTLELRVNQTGS